MKAHKTGHKLIFKYDDNCLRTTEKILMGLKDIVRAFENRNNNILPVNDIKNLVRLCVSLSEEIEDRNIQNEYIEYVNTFKESIGYFKEIEEKFNKEEKILKQKRDVFDSFKGEVKNLSDILDQ